MTDRRASTRNAREIRFVLGWSLLVVWPLGHVTTGESVDCSCPAKTRFPLVFKKKNTFLSLFRSYNRNETFLCFHEWISESSKSGMFRWMINSVTEIFLHFRFSNLIWLWETAQQSLRLCARHTLCALVRSFWKLIMQKTDQPPVNTCCNFLSYVKWNSADERSTHCRNVNDGDPVIDCILSRLLMLGESLINVETFSLF